MCLIKDLNELDDLSAFDDLDGLLTKQNLQEVQKRIASIASLISNATVINLPTRIFSHSAS